MSRWTIIVLGIALAGLATVGIAASEPDAEPSPAVLDNAGLGKLESAVNVARSALQDRLNEKPAYQDARRNLADAQAQLDALPPDADRSDAAGNKLRAESGLNAVIADLIAHDAEVSRANKNLQAALHAMADAFKARRDAVARSVAQAGLVQPEVEQAPANGDESSFDDRQPDSPTNGPATHLLDPDKACYQSVEARLENAGGLLTADVRAAYVDWAERRVLRELRDAKVSISVDCRAEVEHNPDLRDAIFAAVYPPDPSILQNYQHIRSALGSTTMERYRSLAVAFAISRRTKGVDSNSDSPDFGLPYQPGFWRDETLKAVNDDNGEKFVQAIADFMKSTGVSALDVYQSSSRQQQLVEFLRARNIDDDSINRVKEAPEFGQSLKNAMVLLSQRPPARDPKPETVTWMRYLIAQQQAVPTSIPTDNGKLLTWPIFPIAQAPWPLLMPLDHPVPLVEAQYIWEKYQGLHGQDRWHTYGPYRNGIDAMPFMLQPSRWFWDAWPDRIVWGGECVPISKGTTELLSAMGEPAMWSGQPGHANLISFDYASGYWYALIQQEYAGPPDVDWAQWYFNEDPGTQLRYRNLYYWPGSEYHLGLALAMNVGLRSYMDTRIAANIYRALPAEQKSILGIKLLAGTLQENPYNPEIWYRLAEQSPSGADACNLVQYAMSHGTAFGAQPGRPIEVAEAMTNYWKTVDEFVARFAIIDHAAALSPDDLRAESTLLAQVPGIKSADIDRFQNAAAGKS